jgi:hypothetical protein
MQASKATLGAQMGAWKAGLAFSTIDNNAGKKTSNWMILSAYSIGAVVLKANYGSASESASGAADAVTMAGAEVDYALDKATVLFVGYSKINNSKNSKAYYSQADAFPQPALGKSPRDALHNSTRVCAVRIGMGCKAHFAANSACYWQEMQRRRPPEAALAQAVRGYAEHP